MSDGLLSFPYPVNTSPPHILIDSSRSVLQSTGDLAKALSASEVTILGLLGLLRGATKSGPNSCSLYRSIVIPKKAGGSRRILAPVEELKRIQSSIYCWLKTEMSNKKADGKAGKLKGIPRFSQSTFSNALPHRSKRYVFNVDIANYFDSIPRLKVHDSLATALSHIASEHVVDIICSLVTIYDCLPQGSPCSSFLAAIVTSDIDLELIHLANRQGCTYTRYVDDITFSTTSTVFPELIAVRSETTRSSWLPSANLVGILRRHGFEINERKTRMMYNSSRQSVTGLTVNTKPSPPSSYRRATRAMVHSLTTKGCFHISSAKGSKFVGLYSIDFMSQVKRLGSRVSYQACIESSFRAVAKDSAAFSESTFCIYKQLIIFSKMYCLGRTAILPMHSQWAVFVKELGKVVDPDPVTGKSRLTVMRLSAFAKKLFGINSLRDDILTLLSDCIAAYQAFKVALPGAKPLIFWVDESKWLATGYKPSDHDWVHVVDNIYILFNKSDLVKDVDRVARPVALQISHSVLAAVTQIESHLLHHPVSRSQPREDDVCRRERLLQQTSQPVLPPVSRSHPSGMLLFFDTETNGVPKNYKLPETSVDNWPRVIQIAWILVKSDGSIVQQYQCLIKPQGFTIPVEATKIHGITTERAISEGRDLRFVLTEFTNALGASDTVVAHNLPFDAKVIGAEFIRYGQINPIRSKRLICTMQSTADLVRLPGKYGYKWPKLVELHTFLFGSGFSGAHDALVDIQACYRCYFELVSRGYRLESNSHI